MTSPVKAKQSGSSTSAIIVTEELLRRVKRLSDWLYKYNLDELLRDKGITREQVDAGLPDVMHPDYRKIDRYLTDARLLNNVTYNWAYTDGRSFQVSDLDLCIESLKSGVGDIERLYVYSYSFSQTHFNIWFRNQSFSTVSFDVEGEQVAVNHLHLELQRQTADFRPDHPILHGPLLPWLVRGGLSLSVLIGFAWLSVRVSGSASPAVISFIAGAWGIPVGLTLFWLADYPVKYIQQAYPKCDFVFGSQARRTKARRGALAVVILSVALPIITAIIGLL